MGKVDWAVELRLAAKAWADTWPVTYKKGIVKVLDKRLRHTAVKYAKSLQKAKLA